MRWWLGAAALGSVLILCGALVLLVAGLLIFAVVSLFGTPPAERVGKTVQLLIVGTISAVAVPLFLKRRSKRLLTQRQVDCGFRVLEGTHVGLGARWRHGRAVLDAGSISFTPFVFGVRLLPRPQVAIRVAAVDKFSERAAGYRQAFVVAADARLIELTTDAGARLVWALSSHAVSSQAVAIVDPQ